MRLTHPIASILEQQHQYDGHHHHNGYHNKCIDQGKQKGLTPTGSLILLEWNVDASRGKNECVYVYCGLAKERPLMKECPLMKEHAPPTYGPFSCIGQSYLNECPLWKELGVEFEKHSLKRYAYLS